MIVGLIIFLATVVSAQEDDGYAITAIANNPGIYSDQWGSLRTHQTAWNLVTHIDLSTFLQRRNDLDTEWSKLSRECHFLRDYCTIRGQLTAVLDTIQSLGEEQKDIEDLTRDYQDADRRKRAPLGFIGTISRALFGTLDAEDAAFYNERIESLENDTRSVIELVANQTHVMKSKFNEDRVKIGNLSLDFSYKFANMSRALTLITDKMESMQHDERLADAVATLEHYVSENELDTAIITDAILFAKQGQLHPRLLTPQQIIQGAKAIQRARPNSEFPVPLQTRNAPDLLKLSEIIIYHSRGKLVYIISVPLLDLKVYELFKNIPLPIYQYSHREGASFAYIKPSSPFTAISDDLESYFRLTDEDINNCKNIGKRYICKKLNIHYKIDSHSDCEVRILAEPGFQGFEKCDVRIRNSRKTHWSRVHTANQWVFSGATPETLRIRCENRMTHTVVVNGTGILQLKPRCEARSKSVILTSSDEITTAIATEFAPRTTLNISALYQRSMNTSNFPELSDLLSNIDTPTPEKSNKNQDPDLSNGDTEFQSIINRANELLKHRTVNGRIRRLETITGYSGLGLGTILIILGLAWKFSAISKLRWLCTTKGCSKRGRRHSIGCRARFDDRPPIEIVELREPPPLPEAAPWTRSAPTPTIVPTVRPTTYPAILAPPRGAPRALPSAQDVRRPRIPYSERLNSGMV